MKKERYSKYEAPKLDAPTFVKVGISINGFFGINEQTMDYSINMNLKQSWNDPRLRIKRKNNFPYRRFYNQTYVKNYFYNKNKKKIKKKNKNYIKIEDDKDEEDEEEENEDEKRAKGKKEEEEEEEEEDSYKVNEAWKYIWLPDTFFRNEKQANFHSVTVDNRLVIIKINGDVWYDIKISATLSCPMKLHKYPMDTQTCPIMFESFGYTSNVMTLQWLASPVEFKKGMKIVQFNYNGHVLIDCSLNYTAGSFSCLQIDFILQRDMGYFTIQVFFPTFLIVVLSWFSFWISTDAVPARVSLGLLTVLTMANLSISINSNLPRVSYIKAIDIWMSACLLFVFSALCEYAIVNVVSRHRALNKQPALVPKSIKLISDQLREERNNSKLKEKIKKSRSSIIRSHIPGHHFKSLGGKERGEKIDSFSRRAFPTTFVFFNFVYWIGYIHFVEG